MATRLLVGLLILCGVACGIPGQRPEAVAPPITLPYLVSEVGRLRLSLVEGEGRELGFVLECAGVGTQWGVRVLHGPPDRRETPDAEYGQVECREAGQEVGRGTLSGIATLAPGQLVSISLATQPDPRGNSSGVGKESRTFTMGRDGRLREGRADV